MAEAQVAFEGLKANTEARFFAFREAILSDDYSLVLRRDGRCLPFLHDLPFCGVKVD